MSLASTASLWTNDNKNETKKRQPSIRRSTIKLKPYSDNYYDQEDYVSTVETYQNLKNSSPPTMEDTQNEQETKMEKINAILNKIAAVDAANDGNKLADYEPIDKPAFTTDKKGSMTDSNNYQTRRYLDPEELLPQTLQKPKNPLYLANDTDVTNLSNYQNSYERNNTIQYGTPQERPYYANMGLSNSDSKLIEKINYMIHLLEEQQNEKTSNITEEFILYLFLGVFVIYTIDSFTKIGKYVR